MKDKFITNEGVEIPLHETQFTFVEENPRFKDSFWTNYTLPIDYYYNRDFLSQFGQYSSLHNKNLKRYHEGIHIFEGKSRKAKLEIVEFKKDFVKFQIDSGFENLPNFDTKLEDLPLLDKKVADIYAHANEIVPKKYPETDYNFPKLYTDEFNLEDDAYKYFDSFINHRTNLENKAEKEFPRNRIEKETEVYNKNIIHPMPYLLYVLKEGFKDAGFRLEGEILEDEHLKQRLIYSGRHYHNTGDQKEHKVTVYSQEYENTNLNRGTWSKRIRIPAPGKYRLHLALFLIQGNDTQGEMRVSSRNIKAINNLQFSFTENSYRKEFVFSITEDEAEAGAEIIIDYSGGMLVNVYDTQGKNIGVAQLNVLPIRQHSTNGNPIPYIFNENRVNLKKAVPEMSFGELVTAIKNLRNYDLEFDGNRAIMNTIKVRKENGKSQEGILDFREFEVENPTRMFNDKVSFNITFPDVEGVELSNIYIDEKGYHLNHKSVPEGSTEISINVFALPMTMFRGTWTAQAHQESALMLVYYDGLDEQGDNHAKNPKGLMGEDLAQHLLPWFENRLTNFAYKWNFIAKKNALRKFNIRSEIFCYGKRHLIKSWTKKALSEDLYLVEIETETY